MAMVLLDPTAVQQWLDEHHGGDRLVSFTRVVTPANYQVTPGGGASKVGSTEPTMQRLGLDREDASWLLGGKAGLLTLTATNFYLLRLGGLREKIKATAFDGPRDQMQFVAHDLRVHQLDWRHWVTTGFPDGKFLLVPQVVASKGKPTKIGIGSDAFLAELGNQAKHLRS